MPLGDEIQIKSNPLFNIDNKFADYGDYFTSFLPWHDQGMGPESKDGETALYHREEDKYYILNGDWMLAYSELSPQGYEACKAFFLRKREQFGSIWSNTP